LECFFSLVHVLFKATPFLGWSSSHSKISPKMELLIQMYI